MAETDPRDALWARLLDEGTVRWMPGMSDPDGFQLLEVDDDGFCTWWDTTKRETRQCYPDACWTPHWTDPSTLGCLGKMAREAWGEPELHAAWSDHGREWRVWSLGRILAAGPTEAEALLRAIEAAQ